MKKRTRVPVISCLSLVGMIVLVLGVFSGSAMQKNQSSRAEESSMSTLYKTESQVIPPIDITVPSDFQTASFGLG